MNKDTLDKLKELKLYGMYNTFKGSLENYSRNNMTVDKFVNMLVCNEWDERYNRHVNHLIKSAGFRFSASMEEVDYSVERGLDKNLMERLADLTFIKERKNIFITGSSGTGKTFIATALGRCACQKARSAQSGSPSCAAPSERATISFRTRAKHPSGASGDSGANGIFSALSYGFEVARLIRLAASSSTFSACV